MGMSYRHQVFMRQVHVSIICVKSLTSKPTSFSDEFVSTPFSSTFMASSPIGFIPICTRDNKHVNPAAVCCKILETVRTKSVSRAVFFAMHGPNFLAPSSPIRLLLKIKYIPYHSITTTVYVSHLHVMDLTLCRAP